MSTAAQVRTTSTAPQASLTAEDQARIATTQ